MSNPLYLPTAEDDRRHQPGPGALPYWNESFWFPMYDPKQDIGVIFRIGAFPMVGAGEANLYLFVIHKGEIVHSVSDVHIAPAPMEEKRLVLGNGIAIEWLEPLHSFRLVYCHGSTAFDLKWESISPPFKYLHPPDMTIEQVPRHIEQGGRARGTVTIAGRNYEFDGYAHRDHSFGGDRDWDKFYRWTYLSGELGDFWFNAVRIKFSPEMDWIRVGCLWDGQQLLNLSDIDIHVETADGNTRPTAVCAKITDETGREHYIVSESVHGIGPVRIWRTWLRDAIVSYRCGTRRGYGILEHGYLEE